ncbi:hypothetical protein ACSBR2_036676 [Camellia fascicularis]
MSYCQESFYVSIVYGSNSPTVRRRLWSNLRNLKYMVDDKPWINLADFNIGWYCWDPVPVGDFNYCPNDIDAIEIATKGAWFTWSSKQDGMESRKGRFDRFCMNPKWLDLFPNSEAVALSSWLKPILRKLNRAHFSDISKRLAEAKANLEQFQSQNTDIILNDNIVKLDLSYSLSMQN